MWASVEERRGDEPREFMGPARHGWGVAPPRCCSSMAHLDGPTVNAHGASVHLAPQRGFLSLTMHASTLREEGKC